jgi:prolipoprotein diacylglyceryltransferase
MGLLYTLPSPHGHSYYGSCQLAAFAVYVVLLLAHGQRRGYPWRNWLPLVATSTLALVIGCQLVALPPSKWLGWLRGDAAALAAVAAGPRSIIGGATASLLAVLAVRRVLGFRGWGVFDAFGAPLCWALAVQCVGCLLVGCCWGKITTGQNFALVYGPGTLPYFVQQAQGVLPSGAAHSLPLVPTQFYALLLCVGAGLVLHAVRRRAGWPPGSRYLLALGLLMLTRFIIDFWRDPASEPLGGAALTLAGCTLLQVQWLMLLGATLLLGGWAWLVRRPSTAPTPSLLANAGQPALVALGLLVVTTRLAPSTLSAAETLMLQALLLAVLLAEGLAKMVALRRWAPPLAGWPLGVLGGMLLVLMAQAPAPRHQEPSSIERAGGRSLTFSTGSLGNQYDEYVTSGCSPVSHWAYYHRSRAAGADVTYQWASDTTHQTFNAVGGGVWVGTEAVGARRLPTSDFAVENPDYTLNYRLYDVHLYAEGSRPTARHDLDVNYRIGIHLGELGHTQEDFKIFKEAFLPELMLAVGNRRVVYGQFDLAYGAENALANPAVRLALGSGLGQRYGSTVLAGYAQASHYPSRHMGFLSANLRVPGNSALSGLSLEPYFATDFSRHQQFSLKLHYQLPLK